MEEMPSAWQEIIGRIPGDGLKGKYAPINVLGTLMQAPSIMGQFLDYWVTSKLKISFTIREQELVILRMAVHYQCDYVWRHHIPVALEFGISGEEISALKSTPLPRIFSSREEALLVLTDAMVIERDVDLDTWQERTKELTGLEVVELIHLISQYVLFTLANKVLRVEVEAGLNDIPGLKG